MLPYRLLRRRERAWTLMTTTIDATAAEYMGMSTGPQKQLLAGRGAAPGSASEAVCKVEQIC